MNFQISNGFCRFSRGENGQKMLRTCGLDRSIAWRTSAEFILQAETESGEYALHSREFKESSELCDNKITVTFFHSMLDVTVFYELEENTVRKSFKITAHKPLLLKYFQAEVAEVNLPLSRGGEGQPVLIGTDGFSAVCFPAAENRRDGNTLILHQAPFITLDNGESFSVSPVVFGLRRDATVEESFLRFISSRRPHPNDALRIYCDWGAHDELSDDGAPELDEAMATRLLTELEKAKNKYGVRFDYYLMDDNWYQSTEPYTDFNRLNWPEGADRFIRRLETAGMKFGLWFDLNFQRICDEKKELHRGGSDKELCMAYAENMKKLFDAVETHIRVHKVRMLKIDFAFFDCDNSEHSKVHSMRHTASKEPAIRLFCENLQRLRLKYPDLRVLGYNGFTTDMSYIGSVSEKRCPNAVSPFWAQFVDYVYCGDPRPAETPAPLEKSLIHYTDAMIERFRDSLFPTEAIDDHGTMLGNTGTIYYLGKRCLRDSYLMNLVRGTRKCHLYGDVSLLNDADWEFLAKADEIFRFVCREDCSTEPILERPSACRLYGYSNSVGDSGLITIVNTTQETQVATVKLKEWGNGDVLRFERFYGDGERRSEPLENGDSLAVQCRPYAVDIYRWERAEIPKSCGYLRIDAKTAVNLPLPEFTSCVSIRVTDDSQNPIRRNRTVNTELTVNAESGTVDFTPDVPVWSGISHAMLTLNAAEHPVLKFSNNSEKPCTVYWQSHGSEAENT